MRLNPLALALAFGVARIVVSIFSFLTIPAMSSIRTGILGIPSFGGYTFPWVQIFLFDAVIGFIAAAVGGALAAVIYNKVIARRAQAE